MLLKSICDGDKQTLRELLYWMCKENGAEVRKPKARMQLMLNPTRKFSNAN